MEQQHIHNLIKNLSATMRCPKCNGRIFPQNIHLQTSAQKDCVFFVQCHTCGIESIVSAHVEAQLTPEGQKLNASSRLPENAVNMSEIAHAEAHLNENLTISDIFSPQP